MGDGAKYAKEAIAVNRRIYAEVAGSVCLFMLQSLIHKETHAVSRNTISRTYKHEGRSRRLISASEQSGYQNIVDVDPGGPSERVISAFCVFNEGVVETLARDVTRQYLEASGWDPREAKVLMTHMNERKNELHYPREVELVELITKKIASHMGVFEGVVRDAFIQELMARTATIGSGEGCEGDAG